MPARKKTAKKVTFSDENQVFDIPPKEDNNIIEPVPENEELKRKLDAMISDQVTHVVVQLPISAEHVVNILAQEDMCDPLEYNPNIPEPTAYTPVNFFSSKNDELVCYKSENETINNNHDCSNKAEMPDHLGHVADCHDEVCKNAICFWCCHPVEHNQFGMPIRYDPIHNSFTFFGTFCSLECTSAYNFSVHMGSDRAWDVQSWIQIMARSYGIHNTIRPAPSRYTLQMFEGPLTIEEFRKVHKTTAKSVMINIPPMVSMKSQIETINTSFFTTDPVKEPGTEVTKKTTLRRKAPAIESKKTLETKMNLSYTSLTSIIEANA